MYFVVTFNPPIEDFEYIGAFSKKEEADEFAKANVTPHFTPVVLETTFKEIIERATTTRLGEMAKVFEHIAVFGSVAKRLKDGEMAVIMTADTSRLVKAVEYARARLEAEDAKPEKIGDTLARALHKTGNG